MCSLHNYGLVRFSKKTGKNDMIMTAIGKGMLQSWALQNTPKTKACVIVDFDESTDGLYCHYTPYANDCGYAVSDDLLCVCDTSKKDLQTLQDYLLKNGIKSRLGYEWDVEWGWK